jgi:hypothetical protein
VRSVPRAPPPRPSPFLTVVHRNTGQIDASAYESGPARGPNSTAPTRRHLGAPCTGVRTSTTRLPDSRSTSLDVEQSASGRTTATGTRYCDERKVLAWPDQGCRAVEAPAWVTTPCSAAVPLTRTGLVLVRRGRARVRLACRRG